ncbi:hypothetical protein EKO29_13665 [Colwellia sp. Arc7-635]|uniref:hypothetical protein n=1 Tax=Colwellia sp. Arc7-635 TaxID=2497879 RepID=UPI000F856FFE|nr:hypothetical protein [Colwellia sp. Arc7-635]AZQ84943.1 hypothetical protein EKO29_13665 [Colwellia sp. Arc7-635]
MKSQLLLISIIFQFICVFDVQASTDGEKIYEFAKIAFEKNECKETISLLTEYLTLEKPKKDKLISIYTVIGWCATYREKGQIYHHISGALLALIDLFMKRHLLEKI